MCGGEEYDNNRYGFINQCSILAKGGEWKRWNLPLMKREGHTSWVQPDGTVLLVGGKGVYETERISASYVSEKSFRLKHES